MKEWLTAREIADERLPDIPDTERGIQLLAQRHEWASYPLARKRSGRGGGLEYHYHLLPSLAQAAYTHKHMVIGRIAAETSKPNAEMSAELLNDRERLERDARAAILAAYDRFLRGMRTQARAPTTALNHFAIKYNNGSLQVETWVRDTIPSVSPRTIMRWRSTARKDINKLAVDRSKARKGKGVLETANNGRLKDFVIAWIAKNPALSASTIRGYCEDEFGSEVTLPNGEVKPLPETRMFQYFIARVKAENSVVLTKITDPDTYRSHMKLSGTGTLRHIHEPNALWQIDASPVDALCTDGRHSLYACIDIATRRLVITLSKTPRASAVALMVRKAILKWGIAEVIKTDNGSDFVAVSIQQLFASLQITPEPSDAYSPEQKGHVERVIKTFQHEVGPQLPGYIGHSVAERKAIEGRKSFAQRLGADEKDLFEVELSAAELQQKIDDWLDYVYHEREHGGLKKQTPNAVAAASSTPIRRVDERALDVLLMPVAGKNGYRKMQKRGIPIDNFHYLCGSIMQGEELFVRMDPLDKGKAYAFAAKDGRFLGTAICAELSGINPAEFVKAQKELQASLIADQERAIKADIRELKKGPSGIDRTIRLAKRKAAEREAASANVIALPKREEAHVTPQIAAALDALDADKPADVFASVDERQAKIQAEIMADLMPTATGPKVAPIRTSVTPAQKFRRWQDYDQRKRAGQPVSEDEAYWAGSYEQTAEFRAHKALYDDFGDQAPGMRT